MPPIPVTVERDVSYMDAFREAANVQSMVIYHEINSNFDQVSSF